MALGGWAIAAKIAFVSNGMAVMSGLSRQSALLNTSLARQQGTITRNQAAMARYSARLDEIRTKQMKLGTAFAAGGFAIGATFIAAAIHNASDLERAMTGVGIATGATKKQFQDLYGLALKVSTQTAQSAPTIAAELQTAATTAFKDPKQLQAMFPMMARFADIQYIRSNGEEDPVHAVTAMSQFAHFFGAYTPDKFKPVVDDMARLLFTTHATMNQLVTQGKYFIPNAVKQGVGEDQIMQYLAIAGQTGMLSGRAGTSLNNFINRGAGLALGLAAQTKPDQNGLTKRNSELGLRLYDEKGRFRFTDAQGNFQLDSMMRWLQADRERMKAADPRRGNAEFMGYVQKIFGVEATRFVSIAADSTTRAQMNRNKTAFQRIPGIDKQWETYTHNFFYQWNLFMTNIKDIGTALGLAILPDVTKWLTSFNVGLSNFVMILFHHQEAAKKVMMVIAGLTALMGGRFLFGLTMMASKLMGIGGIAAMGGGLGGFFKFIDMFVSGGLITKLVTFLAGFVRLGAIAGFLAIPAVGWTAAIIAGVAALAFAFKNLPNLISMVSKWWKYSQGPIAYTISFGLASVTQMIVNGLKAMISALSSIASQIGPMLAAQIPKILSASFDPASLGGAVVDMAGKAFGSAFSHWSPGGQQGFGEAWARGWKGGRQGHSFQLHGKDQFIVPRHETGGQGFARDRQQRMGGINLHVSFNAPVSKADASHVARQVGMAVKSAVKSTQTAIRQSGVAAVSPNAHSGAALGLGVGA